MKIFNVLNVMKNLQTVRNVTMKKLGKFFNLNVMNALQDII